MYVYYLLLHAYVVHKWIRSALNYASCTHLGTFNISSIAVFMMVTTTCIYQMWLEHTMAVPSLDWTLPGYVCRHMHAWVEYNSVVIRRWTWMHASRVQLEHWVVQSFRVPLYMCTVSKRLGMKSTSKNTDASFAKLKKVYFIFMQWFSMNAGSTSWKVIFWV